MAAAEWVVTSDGCLRCEEGLHGLAYHPSLNAVLAVTRSATVKVIDGTSGALLQVSGLNAKAGGQIECHYLSGVDKVVFTDGFAVGCRKDLNGILLLDTALQAAVTKPDDPVHLELPVSEAQQLLSVCQRKIDVSGTEGYDQFISQLRDGVRSSTQEPALSHKVAKWATVKLCLPHHVLRSAAAGVVNELKRVGLNLAALPVAAALMDRLAYLLPSAQAELGGGPGRPVDRSLMYSEANRRETFTSWPHAHYRWAQPDPMAQAGFYHQPTSNGDDRAMCFTCSVCLVSWEPTDEPWSEHERHSPNCPYVKGEHTQNVPIAVTLATAPSQVPQGDGSERVAWLGVGSCPATLATSTRHGRVCIWDVHKQMKVQARFCMNPRDPMIMRRLARTERISADEDSTKPCLTWTDDTSSSSDVPRLESDSDDQLEDSDSEPLPSLAELIMGASSVKEDSAAVTSLEVTALTLLQQPETQQWEMVASVIDGAVKDLEELQENMSPVLCGGGGKQASSKGGGNKEQMSLLSVPCLLAGVLVISKAAPVGSSECSQLQNAEPSQTERVMAMEVESSLNLSQGSSQTGPRMVPMLLTYAIKGSEEKEGKSFSQLDALVSGKSLPEEDIGVGGTFPVPQILELELDQHQFFLQEPIGVSYVQQLAQATQGLTNVDRKSSATVVPRPGALVQCLPLPRFSEEERMSVHSITPCSDGMHILVILEPRASDATTASGVEAMNRLNSALCEAEGQGMNSSSLKPPLNRHESDAEDAETRATSGGYCLLYKLNFNTRTVTLHEEPVRIHRIADPSNAITSLILLSPDAFNGRDEDLEEQSEKVHLGQTQPSKPGVPDEKRMLGAHLGHFVVTTREGYVKIMELSTFETVASVVPPKKDNNGAVDPFVSVVYCSGSDRLCSCTRGGEIHFLQVGEPNEEVDSVTMFQESSCTKAEEKVQEASKHSASPASPAMAGVELLAAQPVLTTSALTALVELTQFETLTPRFSATVPPCWAELQQEQQQRRHPQHLHGQQHGDAAQHTRTWKLQPDNKSWDEQIFEIVLPKVCMVGHVDLKFILNTDVASIPQIQVTLLRNRSPGLGKINDCAVDSKVAFPLTTPWCMNSAGQGSSLLDGREGCEAMDIDEGTEAGTKLCPFLDDHKEDILCGPEWLGNGLDLSGHAGVLTLTSPALIKGMAGGKYRSFLIHIKAVNGDRANEDGSYAGNNGRSIYRAPTLKPTTNQGHSLATFLLKATATKDKGATPKFGENGNSSKKSKKLQGCDVLQEVSITIRKFKKTSIPKERVQRLAMLELADFPERLLLLLCLRTDEGPPATEQARSLALDVLCWLAGVHAHAQQCSSKDGVDSLSIKTQCHLVDLVRCCFLEAGRSIAHKCAKFLTLCISNGRTEAIRKEFSRALLLALLDNLPYIPAAATAGALYWYFVLLNYVKEEDLAECSTACAALLMAVSRQLTDRLTPLEALLRARYGLYRSPFDPLLFDFEMSGSSYKNAYLVSSSSNVQSDEIDLSEIMTGNGKVAGGAAADSSFTALTGLLEVEPLHFTCVATSDGTRVEKDERGNGFGMMAGPGGAAAANSGGDTSQALSTAAQAALHSLSTAMATAEHQLHALQEKQHQLLKLQQQKVKLEAKLHQTTAAAAAAASAAGASVTAGPSAAPLMSSAAAAVAHHPGYYPYSSELFPPTPKTTPLFMTPPLTPPNEPVHVPVTSAPTVNGDLSHFFPPPAFSELNPVTVALHTSKSSKSKSSSAGKSSAASPCSSGPTSLAGGGLAQALTQASQLLQPPTYQSMVIERMHSGARRFVTLDFGRPVLLTDLLVPACSELASLAIDVWTRGEEVDGRRLVVTPDIGTHSLILHDLLPAPVCRFLKVTVIGKYGSTNARAKIPLGLYYGHTYILPWEQEGRTIVGEPDSTSREAESQEELEQQLSTLVTLQEDIQCRYNLACHRLETLLHAVDLPPLSSAGNGHHSLRRPERAAEEDARVCAAYQACAQLQLQLNLAHHAVARLRVALGAPRSEGGFVGGGGPTTAWSSRKEEDAAAGGGLPESNRSQRDLILGSSTEQLRTVIKYLLDTLLSVLHTSNGQPVPSVLQQTFQATACEELFKHLCLSGTPRIRLHAGLLLVQLCGGERWWGRFLANVLQELYNSQQLLVFPQDRVFILLSCLGRRSLSNSGVLESLLALLDRLLSPLQPQSTGWEDVQPCGVLDIPLVSWVLMLVSRLLDCVTSAEDEGLAVGAGGKKIAVDKEIERLLAGNQWSFVNNSFQPQSLSRSSKGHSRLYLNKIRKQLMHHKQQLSVLKAKQKALVEQIEKEKTQINKGGSYKLLMEQAKLKQATSKHFKDLLRLRRVSGWARPGGEAGEQAAGTGWDGPEVEPLPFTLPHQQCIPVVQKLLSFLLAMDFTCHADLFLFVCKVLARLSNCTRPSIHLSEIVTERQLERLLLLMVGTDFNKGTIAWGGAWAQHALTCMLQDILAGELQSSGSVGDGVTDDGVTLGDEAAGAMPDMSDDSPQPSTSNSIGEPSESEPVTPDILVTVTAASMEKDKDMEMLQDFAEIPVFPFDVYYDDDPLAAKVFKPPGGSWYDHWVYSDYTTYAYPTHSGVTVPVTKTANNTNNNNVDKASTQTFSILVSQAVDARLEVGLDLQAELMLKMMATLEADSVLQALTTATPSAAMVRQGMVLETLLWGSNNQAQAVSTPAASTPMLSACFNRLFSSLQLHQVQLDSLLHLWLTLSQSSSPSSLDDNTSELYTFCANKAPAIPLSQVSISTLLAALAWYPDASLRTWCLALQSLALMTNIQATPSAGVSSATTDSIAQAMVLDTNLVVALGRFLSGRNLHSTNHYSTQVGPTVIQALQEFLSRLQVHLSPTYPSLFNEFLLRLVQTLSAERGPFYTGEGPLDAQVKLLEFTLEQAYESVVVEAALGTVESVAALVHTYITCSDRLVSRSSSEGAVGARSCFGGLFSNSTRPGETQAPMCSGAEVTRDRLMFNLLKLLSLLVRLPLSGDRTHTTRVQPEATGATATGSSSTGSVSDEEKASSGGGRDAEGGLTPERPAQACVADLVLANQQIMSQILSALSQCNSNTMAMIMGASGLHLSKHESLHSGMDAISVGDGLFSILSTLSQRATSPQLMLQPILTYMACGYMGRQGSLATCQMSEPLLWFILRVLDSAEALKTFHLMGGVQLICNNMVTSTRAVINTARSMVSTIMRFLDLGPGRSHDGGLKARVLTSEADNSEGLHNFAPYGTITSSSPTAQPAEVLLQATPPHRRARSAAWSYVFLPEEAWSDLTIHLPAAVLLREIHIQPHLASLATCPSSVSVELSADGVSMLPVSCPVVTSGLTYIKLQLVKAEVATAVCLRLHRPRDSGTLGLSQIKLLGLTAFGGMSCSTVNNPFLPTEDQVSKTSIGWLRLLHHCMTHVSELEGVMASAAAPTANLLQTCAALLVSPYCGMHAPSIEAVLVRLGLQSAPMGLRLIDILLRDGAACGTRPNDLNSPLLLGRLNGLSSDSTVDILYQLGTTQDSGTRARVRSLLQWVAECARLGGSRRPDALSSEQGLLVPSPSHVHCVAAILWHSYELPVQYDLPGLLTRELFQALYTWSTSLPFSVALKKAVDWLLCTFCHIHPSYFPGLLGWLGVPLPSLQAQRSMALTDDSKKADLREGLTDDSKRGSAMLNTDDRVPLASTLDELRLATLAAVAQSPEATRQLLDSRFPAHLAQGLVDCCLALISATASSPSSDQAPCTSRNGAYAEADGPHHMELTADLVTPVLRFFTEVGSSHTMKDWLGGPEGRPLWTSLLSLLCYSVSTSSPSTLSSSATSSSSTPSSSSASLSTGGCSANGAASSCGAPRPCLTSLASASPGVLTTQQKSSIENAAVAFFTQCICGHPSNQKLMAQVLCELFHVTPLRNNLPVSGSISGFMRRLFLQLMLEDEKVLVFLHSPCPLYKGRVNAISHMIQHPMYGAGHKFRTLQLPVSTTLASVLDRVSDTPSITAKLFGGQKEEKEKKPQERKEKGKFDSGLQDAYGVVMASGLKSQSKRSVSATPPRPPTRRGRTAVNPTLAERASADSASKTISIPVLLLYHRLLPGQPLPPELTLAQLLALLHDLKLPQGFCSIDLTVKLGSKVIPDSSLSKTDAYKRLRTEKEQGVELPLACVEAEGLQTVEESMDVALDESLLETAPVQSPLQVFAGLGGLALIAERLPMLYPDIIQQVSGPMMAASGQDRGTRDPEQFEWVTLEPSGEMGGYEPTEILEPCVAPSTSGSTVAVSVAKPLPRPPSFCPIPAHSLAAFGLFLRLPGYAEVLLRERKHAQCLLRLVLGVTDDAEGGHILQSPSAGVLPTLPFHVLRTLFSSTPLTTDDGVLLRRMALEIGAVHLLLACLSVLSHHAPRVSSSSLTQAEMATGGAGQVAAGPGDDQQLYWAKGTGFGTGSTTSGWDVEQALSKQRMEEEHVTCLLQVLASYMNPGGVYPAAEAHGGEAGRPSHTPLPPMLLELLCQSCLTLAVASYLRNDSVLDMARHVPLYRALLELLRAIALCPPLVPLLLPLSGGPPSDVQEDSETASQGCISALLTKMKTCVDTYSNRLSNLSRHCGGGIRNAVLNSSLYSRQTSKKERGKANGKVDSEAEAEGLTLLVPDIQRTAEIVHKATTSLKQATLDKQDLENRSIFSRPRMSTAGKSMEERYVSIMKDLQFDTFELVSEDEDGKLVFKVSHHYMSQVKSANDSNGAPRARRLAQEAVTLSTSLPLSACSSVFVRCDEERLDIMKVLITGPADTPYANGCFEFDVYFPQDYPNSPPLVNLETTGRNSVRFNPNLYNDGKVCLSILNTWHGRPEEKWNPQTSSFLQVLVSVQSLILVSEPYFNEPGYERSRGTPSGAQSSREYDANIRQATVKWAMLEQICSPSPCFREVILKHFYLKRVEIMAQCEEWIADIQQYSTDKRVGRTMAHHAAALKRHTAQLREVLMKLPCPDGLDPDEAMTAANPAAMLHSDTGSQQPLHGSQFDSGLGRPSPGSLGEMMMGLVTGASQWPSLAAEYPEETELVPGDGSELETKAELPPAEGGVDDGTSSDMGKL
ncbi:dual E2 ubiquitin-conjugating enzyme/E3 ubiquitin-protein ligase BIRC6 isoform X2 [Lampetra fluviatilis]